MNQETVNNILGISTLTVMITSLLFAPYKSGLSYSPWSLFSKDQKKFKIDESKLAIYSGSVLLAFSIMLLYLLVLTKDAHEALTYAAFNTAFIAYALAYRVLLKKR